MSVNGKLGGEVWAAFRLVWVNLRSCVLAVQLGMSSSHLVDIFSLGSVFPSLIGFWTAALGVKLLTL